MREFGRGFLALSSAEVLLTVRISDDKEARCGKVSLVIMVWTATIMAMISRDIMWTSGGH
jgi:hypothetical protein